jgi:hypothetical protein
MTEEKIRYRRLPGRARKRWAFSWERSALWLAPDHVLHVRTAGYTESCKRFYLADIQALVVCKTTAGATLNVVMGGLAGLLGLVAAVGLLGLMVGSEAGIPDWSVAVFAATAGVFVLAVLINTALGPTCVCRLHTAVQVEHLPSLGRLRTARRTLAILRPLIEAAQGRLTPEDLETGTESPAVVTLSPVAVEMRATAAGSPRPRTHDHGAVHAGLFGMLLVLAASSVIDVFFQHPLKNFADMALYVVSVVLAVVALGRQRDSDFPPGLRNCTWAALIFLIGAFCLGGFYGVVYGVQYAVEHKGEFVNPYAVDFHLEGPFLVGFCLVQAVVETVLAATGFGLLRAFRRAYAASRFVVTPEKTAPEQEL